MELNKVQWTMSVSVFHGPNGWHQVEIATETKGKPRLSDNYDIGRWQGLGVPADVMNDMEVLLLAAFQEHIYARYGVQDTLTGKWAGEPDPF